MKDGCIFCDIINGDAPGRIVYRDGMTIAFFPRRPNARGHTLICPVEHHADMLCMPQAAFESMLVVTHRLARHYRDELGATGVNILNASGADAQQSVFHCHLHLLPRFPGDGLDTWPNIPEWQGDLDELLRQVQIRDEDTQPSVSGDASQRA